MGEYSKRVGEVGESVVADLLRLLGWQNIMRNEDIDSIDTDFRKKTNGVDGYYHYNNPMISNTIENVIYSCKYSTSPYPTSQAQIVNTFKSYYTDLAKAIESFKKSILKQKTCEGYEFIDNCFDRGVLFWLNNSSDRDKDLITKLGKIELTTETNHDGIFLVDNKRAEFLYNAMSYALAAYRGYDIDFIYFINGLNMADTNLRNGKIMPVEYINSSILPLRLSKEKETIVMLFTIDDFDENDLMKYFGIANKIGCNTQGSTVICFPNYLETKHKTIVEAKKQIFQESSFTTNLHIVNYNQPLLR